MKLADLIHNLPATLQSGPENPVVGGLAYDSRQVVEGGAFFALRGLQTDGHQFVAQAVANGAVVVFVERDIQVPPEVTVVRVPDCRAVIGEIAHRFYGEPTAGMLVVGVTGTNGKTTVTYLVEELLKEAGRRPAVFGTIAYRFEESSYAASHTTPEAIDLIRTIAEFKQLGCDALVMEVSSHALAQQRVGGIDFDVVAFTNLTPEHLDYHRDLEDYFAAKALLFHAASGSTRKKVVNLDDGFGRRLAAEHPEAMTYGVDATAAVAAENPKIDMDGIHARLKTPFGTSEIGSRLLGRFNLENLLCAAAVGVQIGLVPDRICRALSAARPVPGRLEPVPNGLGALILVDYAHTGDALEKALSTLKALRPRRLVTLFGCGGDRDRTKRPVMGGVAGRYSDLAIVTSDNPRTEDPEAILADIRPGIEPLLPELTLDQLRQEERRGFVVIPDRREALALAVTLLQQGDLLLAAGKGHEDYQIIGREKQHLDDREELRRAVARRGGESCS